MMTDILTRAPVEDAPSSLWRDAWYRLRRNLLAVACLVIVVVLLLAAIIGPSFSPYDFLGQDLAQRTQSPSWQHLSGTDDLGRDVLARVLHGARTAFIVAITVTVVAVMIGVMLGAAAGFYGGMLDKFVMWFKDMTMSVPQLPLVVVINASLKQPISNRRHPLGKTRMKTPGMKTIGITMGDPAGVGPEIIVKCLTAMTPAERATIRVYGNCESLDRAARALNTPLPDMDIHHTDIPAGPLPFGKLDPRAGEACFQFINSTVEDALANIIACIVTAPINREALNAAGHRYDGHTGTLAALTGAKSSFMLLTSDRLSVIHNSTHVH